MLEYHEIANEMFRFKLNFRHKEKSHSHHLDCSVK